VGSRLWIGNSVCTERQGEGVERGLVDALRRHAPALIAVGGSAGALDALHEILPALPASLPAAVVIVLHVPPDGNGMMPAVLATGCALPVREAEDKMRIRSGAVYVAPPDYHLLLEARDSLALSMDRPVHYSRPSIDVLFESAAHAAGAGVLGVLLSGASVDGAKGLALIRERGGMTWVQAPETAAVSVMPQAALALAGHDELDAEEMARALAAWGCLSG
jgi:two-component system chemotaxis response regulator CheB